MKLDELIKQISEKSGSTINQSMLAESLGITRQTISNRIKNESEVTVSELKKIEEYFNIDLLNNLQGITYIDYYENVFASCGNGSIVFSSEKTKLPISTSMINGYSKSKLYSMINASGNSMSPTIDSGDKLIVEHWNGYQIQDNKIYVFCYKNEFFVKRLAKNVDELIVKSDNSAYAQRIISNNELEEVVVLGRVVGVVRTV